MNFFEFAASLAGVGLSKRTEFSTPASNLRETKSIFKPSDLSDDISISQKEISKGAKYKTPNQDLLFLYSEKSETNEKISFGEFQIIDFDHPVPNLMIDLIKYLSGYSMYQDPIYVPIVPTIDIDEDQIALVRRQIGDDLFNDLQIGFHKL